MIPCEFMIRPLQSRFTSLALGLVLTVAGVAGAKEKGDAKPWEKGVSAAVRKRVESRFKRGNEFFVERQCKEAATEYRAALAEWDHPRIRYNLAVCLLEIGADAIETYEHLVSALRFGEAPLGADLHREAKRYLALVKKQISWVEARCDIDGARVSLDGKQLFVGPGSREIRTLPGKHQLVAEAAGYETRTLTFSTGPAEKRSVDIELFRPGKARRRYPKWVPWSVTLAGAAAVAGGVVFGLSARDASQDYEQAAVVECPLGCPLDDLSQGTRDLRDKARSRETLAFIGYGIGGAAIAAGIVLFLFGEEAPVKATPGGVAIQF